MKKLLLLSALLIFACSSDDDNNIAGCTDSGAVNYNPSASQSDGNCQYSITGNWGCTSFIIDGINVLEAFNYFDLLIYGDGAYIINAEDIDGVQTSDSGVANYDSNTNSLILISDVGSVENWNVTYLDGLSLNMNINMEGMQANSEWIKY